MLGVRHYTRRQGFKYQPQLISQFPKLVHTLCRTSISCCGGNCGCGSGCKCGSSCKGCGMHPDLGTERTVTSGNIIGGVAPVVVYLGESEMSFEAENGGCGCGSKCRSNCSCK